MDSMDSKEKNIDCTFFDSDLEEIEHHLQEFDKMKESMRSSSSSSISEANDSKTIKNALARLEEDFRYILIAYTTSNSSENDSFSDSSFSSSPSHFRLSISSTPNVSGNQKHGSYEPTEESLSFPSIISIPELDLILIESKAIQSLRCIAERMIASGLAQECIQAYWSIRRPVMDANFLKLGIEMLSTREAQMLGWDGLEEKIKMWIQAVRACFRFLFVNEKMLLDKIFQGLSFDRDLDGTSFMETVKAPAMQLFTFAEVVSTVSRRSSERLFGILDIYNALSNLLPDIEIVFEGKRLESIQAQATGTLSKLAEVIRGILEEFENTVLNEISEISPDGNILPLTRYVMYYTKMIAALYKQPMTEIIVSMPPAMESKNLFGDGNMDLEVERMSPLAFHLIWIIVILQFILGGKSKNYKDASLSHLFMMNNVHYIVQKIKVSPELREMIGYDYLKLLTGKFRMEATNYERSTWVRVLSCLRDQGLSVSGSGVSMSALRERFKTFNARFEEVHRAQATWLVPDIQLREDLRISISQKLIASYRSFLGRFGNCIKSGSRHPENYIKYTAEELENAMFDLFEGNIQKEEIKMTCM